MKTTKRILFVVNGNYKIGYGHIARNIVLGKKFHDEKWDISFLVKKDCAFISNINEYFNYHLCDNYTQQGCADVIQSIIGTDIVVIDLIENEYNDFAWIRDILPNSILASITLFLFDLNKRYENLSFFPSIQDTSFTTSKNFSLFTGPKYFIFRDEFNLKELKPQNEDASKILITMGGTDPYDLSLLVLKALLNTKYQITLLLSLKSKSYSTIRALINESNNRNITLIDFTSHIAKEMIAADIIILNGGGTRYEACLCQTPFIAISIHKTQFNITKQLTDLNVGINLGVKENINEQIILDSVNDLVKNRLLRKEMATNMYNIIDTNGHNRIYKIISEQLKC